MHFWLRKALQVCFSSRSGSLPWFHVMLSLWARGFFMHGKEKYSFVLTYIGNMNIPELCKVTPGCIWADPWESTQGLLDKFCGIKNITACLSYRWQKFSISKHWKEKEKKKKKILLKSPVRIFSTQTRKKERKGEGKNCYNQAC